MLKRVDYRGISMTEEEKTPTEAFKDLKNSAEPLIELVKHLPDILFRWKVQKSMETSQNHSRIITQSVLFVSTWRKFFQDDNGIEPKFTEFYSLLDKLNEQIDIDIRFYVNFLGKLDDKPMDLNINNPIYKEFSSFIENRDEYDDNLLRFSTLFNEIKETFIEEGELPIFPEAVVIEHTKFIDSKEHDDWKDGG